MLRPTHHKLQEDVLLHLSQHINQPFMQLNSFELNALPLSLIHEKLISRHRVLPLFKQNSQLFIATDEPDNLMMLKEIQFHTGMSTYPVQVDTEQLNCIINTLLNKKESQGLEGYFKKNPITEELESTSDVDDAPIVKFVNRILLEAIHKSVSDIHFEPYEHEFRIRYRLDGLLYQVSSHSISLASRITARIKIMANLDISERRIPQDGRFKMSLSSEKSMNFRVSSCPTIGGEKIVIRILDPETTNIGIDALGFNVWQKTIFLNHIHRPQGLILVTGPTGSGKTATLYSALNLLNTLDVNISTVEDPVEIKLCGINQVNINPKAGLEFSNALRSFLRQDPDIIMVGEIRDYETAEIAIKAAQTGHLVLSTLHTNSAAETLTRLVNMGIPSFNIASSISLIIAQRLIRKLCDSCKQGRDDTTPNSLIELGFSKDDAENIQLYKAVGCNQCTNGYRGRMGVFEIMPMNKSLGQLIMSGGNSLDIQKQATASGMLTIYQSGLEKIKAGLTTMEEVNRVTMERI